jgi:hypothetical protein
MRWNDASNSWVSVKGEVNPVRELTIPTSKEHAERQQTWERTMKLAGQLQVEADTVLLRNHIALQILNFKSHTFSVEYPRNLYQPEAQDRIEVELKTNGWEILDEKVTDIVKWKITREI